MEKKKRLFYIYSLYCLPPLACNKQKLWCRTLSMTEKVIVWEWIARCRFMSRTYVRSKKMKLLLILVPFWINSHVAQIFYSFKNKSMLLGIISSMNNNLRAATVPSTSGFERYEHFFTRFYTSAYFTRLTILNFSCCHLNIEYRYTYYLNNFFKKRFVINLDNLYTNLRIILLVVSYIFESTYHIRSV